MKKFICLFLFTVVASFGAQASSMYKVDDTAIETAFNLATPLTLGISEFTSSIASPMAVQASGGKSAFLAIVLDFFLGGIAIHRVYLGGTPILIVGYIVTIGGIFGLVPLVDFFVLIFNASDISKYENNNKFFMW